MYVSEVNIRVRYNETDQMGYVHHANYACFYELGRTELFRKIGFPYSELEKSGVMLPVFSLKVNYLKPAFYDEKITIKTYLRKMPKVKLMFDYEIFNEKGILLNTGETSLAFINKETRIVMRAPQFLLNYFTKYFE
ncbi:MAG: acyl-CoA thioesterase [Bacteroidetes bacterium]|jgi:acyl-CoA thioester hydrolase|nr:acyl-CoA thioesterase [Bacteroidota bacterium]MBT6687132.1 acyl-CoA thioesterase [Bacteroidota bacterium]MBT7145137.1 acyl-CoA thioesterase [Bacteroidota bacterium]MBT7491930.1 acyl-CoA thioesterase [Bacteroidota bacterium]